MLTEYSTKLAMTAMFDMALNRRGNAKVESVNPSRVGSPPDGELGKITFHMPNRPVPRPLGGQP